jgi:hypothetical protein
VDTPRNIFNNKTIPYPSQCRSWWQKPRHTLLGRALETFQTGQSARGCAHLRRLTPTKHTAGPLQAIWGEPKEEIMELLPSSLQACHTFCKDSISRLKAPPAQKVRHTLKGWSEKNYLISVSRLPQPFSGTAFLNGRNLQ